MPTLPRIALGTGPNTAGADTLYNAMLKTNAAMDAIDAASMPDVLASFLTAADVVRVFIYDTRYDSDGGVWTDQQQHTTWWNEALGTTTRGVKRAFPKVALLVVRTNTFGIYDALDLDPTTGAPRMWMLFNGGNALQSGGISAVAALNGQIVLAMAGASITRIDFPRDLSGNHQQAAVTYRICTIANRNSATSFRKAWGGTFPSSAVNDVAMRVLPGAPLDAVSGLPIPTILIGHQAGASFIHPDERISTISDAGGMVRVAFLSDHYVAITRNASPSTHIGPIFYGSSLAHTSWGIRQFGSGTALSIPGASNGFRHYVAPNGAVGSALGLTFFAHDHSNLNNGMAAQVAPSYATGWMPGDIRLATLCEGTTGPVTGVELVANGSFATDASGWSLDGGGGTANGGWDAGAGGRIFIQGDGTNRGRAAYPISCVVGETYLVSVACSPAFPTVAFGTTAHNNNVQILSSYAIGGTLFIVFTAPTATVWIGWNSQGTTILYLDSVSARLCTLDRSYLQRGVGVQGTLTRAAVTTGADLVGWSGFSTTSFLEQPYNPALDFADGDFAIIGWFKRDPTAAAETLLERRAPGGGPRFTLALDATTSQLRFTTDDDPDVVSVATNTSTATDEGLWHQFVAVMRGTTLELWFDGFLAGTADATAVGTLSNAAAVLRAGCDLASTTPFGGSLSPLRMTGYAPTRAQIERMYYDEAALFDTGAKAFLGGTSTNVVAVDSPRVGRRLLAATSDGASLFNGLRRVDFFDNTTAPGAIANKSLRSVSIEGGMMAFGSTTNAGLRREAFNPADQSLPSPALGGALRRFDARGVTVDASPLVLVPRLHVSERETVVVEAVVVGRVHGGADSQRLSYMRRAAAYRDTGGNITLQGAVQTVGTDTEVTATADATIVVDTAAQTIAVQVTGIAATRIAWRAYLRITRASEVTQYEEVL